MICMMLTILLFVFICHFHKIYISVTYTESAHFYWLYAYFIPKDEKQN